MINLLPADISVVQAPPSRSRKIYAGFIADKQINKVVLATTNIFLKVTGKFIIAMAGKGDKMRLASSEKEAIAWLKEL
ncbi:hypothetical protein HN928_06505 [bacterium]|nr:hypothetical protein [bacterium]MBT3580941.1 hypothetical protein [bacterium]MBT7088594.1 hypothetical protein [bacterium]